MESAAYVNGKGRRVTSKIWKQSILSAMVCLMAFLLTLNVYAEAEPETYVLRSGQRGQVWGMEKIQKTPVVIEELQPGFVSDDYSKILQTGPTYSEYTMTAYCIQYGRPCPAGGEYTGLPMDIAQKKYMGYALGYGWNQTGHEYSPEQYRDVKNKTEYAITQAVIWACSQNKFATDAGDRAVLKMADHTFDPGYARGYYQKLRQQILEAETIPSFSSGDEGKAPVIEMTWNESANRYEVLLTDEKNVLDRYDYQCPGLAFAREGNHLLVSTTKELPGEVTASAVYQTQGGEGGIAFWDGDNGNQDLTTFQAAPVDIPSYVAFKTESTGSLEIIKASANPEISENHPDYSLEGAIYGLYQNEQEVGRMTTDRNGKASITGLKRGQYQLREIQPPMGFAKDGASYDVMIDGTVPVRLELEDVPQSAAIQLLLQKIDSESKVNRPQGSGSLGGAVFLVRYYKQPVFTPEDMERFFPERSWLFETDAGGQIKFTEKYLHVQGDLYMQNGKPVIPLGTVVIQEIQAPVGYEINHQPFFCRIKSQGTGETVKISHQPVVQEQVIRGDFRFLKKDSRGKLLSGIPFKITSRTTGEHHTVYSDANGKVTTEELWFGEGRETASKGGLPYDTYCVEELPCEANKDKELISPFDVCVDQPHQLIELKDVINEDKDRPSIHTKAVGLETGNGFLPADSPITIQDEIFYEHLIPGETYTIRGKLIDKQTKKELMCNGKAVSVEKIFTPDRSDGSVTVDFTFNGSGMELKEIVVFQELFYNEKQVAKHCDLQSKEQTVRIFPIEIHTAACDESSGAQTVVGKNELVILDRVDYTGLIPGRTYRVEGILMDYDTGKPLLEEGKEIRASEVFTPSRPDGFVEVRFPLDVSKTGKVKTVVFEKLKAEDGTELAAHEDLQDESQTVTVTPKEAVPPTGCSIDFKTPLILICLISVFVGGVVFFRIKLD